MVLGATAAAATAALRQVVVYGKRHLMVRVSDQQCLQSKALMQANRLSHHLVLQSQLPSQAAAKLYIHLKPSLDTDIPCMT